MDSVHYICSECGKEATPNRRPGDSPGDVVEDYCRNCGEDHDLKVHAPHRP